MRRSRLIPTTLLVAIATVTALAGGSVTARSPAGDAMPVCVTLADTRTSQLLIRRQSPIALTRAQQGVDGAFAARTQEIPETDDVMIVVDLIFKDVY